MRLNNRGASGSYGDVTQLRNYDGAPGPIAVASTAVVYSRPFRLNYGTAFGIWYQLAGTGTPNVKIEMEQSYKAPTLDNNASDAAWVIPSGVAPIETSLSGTTAAIKSVSPVPMKYGRLKITGLGSNPADCTLNAWLFQQEL